MTRQCAHAERYRGRAAWMLAVLVVAATRSSPGSSEPSGACAAALDDTTRDWLRLEAAALGGEIVLAGRLAARLGLGRLAHGLRVARDTFRPGAVVRAVAILRAAPHVPGACVLLPEVVPLLAQPDPELGTAALAFLGDALYAVRPLTGSTCELPPGFTRAVCGHLTTLAEASFLPLPLRLHALGLLIAASALDGECAAPAPDKWSRDRDPELRRLALFLPPVSAQSQEDIMSALEDEDPRVALAAGLRLCQLVETPLAPMLTGRTTLARARDIAIRFARSTSVTVADLVELLECLWQRDAELAREPMALARGSAQAAVRAMAHSLH